MKEKHLLPLLAVLILTSCIPNKKIIYLQDTLAEFSADTLFNPTYPDYLLQVGDILNIDVKSSDPNITLIFKPTSMMSNQAMLANSAADVNYLNGYVIETNGDVKLPLTGNVSVGGLKLHEAQEIIERAIKGYITDAFVQVRLGGVRYSALGEFKMPGRYSILQSKVTIFEAIANAGDLNIIANREKIILIRQYTDGAKTHVLNLTDRKILTSEFYYLQPNDLIYAEPLPVRQFGGGVGVTGIQTITTILSAVSSLLLIVVSINRL